MSFNNRRLFIESDSSSDLDTNTTIDNNDFFFKNESNANKQSTAVKPEMVGIADQIPAKSKKRRGRPPKSSKVARYEKWINSGNKSNYNSYIIKQPGLHRVRKVTFQLDNFGPGPMYNSKESLPEKDGNTEISSNDIILKDNSVVLISPSDSSKCNISLGQKYQDMNLLYDDLQSQEFYTKLEQLRKSQNLFSARNFETNKITNNVPTTRDNLTTCREDNSYSIYNAENRFLNEGCPEQSNAFPISNVNIVENRRYNIPYSNEEPYYIQAPVYNGGFGGGHYLPLLNSLRKRSKLKTQTNAQIKTKSPIRSNTGFNKNNSQIYSLGQHKIENVGDNTMRNSTEPSAFYKNSNDRKTENFDYYT